MSKLIKFLTKHWISIPLCLVVLYLCFMRTQSLPEVNIVGIDKLAHVIMFFGLSCVIYFENSSYFSKKVPLRTIVIYSFLFPTIFSGLIEIGQEHLTDYRSGEWMDFVSDVIGTSMALMICLLINKRLKK